MRFRFCFLLSTFLAFKGNSIDLDKPDKALDLWHGVSPETLKDSAVAIPVGTSDGHNSFDQQLADKAQPSSTTNNQSPSMDSQGLPDLISSKAPYLLAQSTFDEVPRMPGSDAGVGTAVDAGFTGLLDLLWGRIQDVGHYLDDTKPFTGFKKDSNEIPSRRGKIQGGIDTMLGGTGGNFGASGTGQEGSCTSPRFGNRALVWCDFGYPQTAQLTDDHEITVFGYDYCTSSPPFPPNLPTRTFSLITYISLTSMILSRNLDEFVGGCLGSYQVWWCCATLDYVEPHVSRVH